VTLCVAGGDPTRLPCTQVREAREAARQLRTKADTDQAAAARALAAREQKEAELRAQSRAAAEAAAAEVRAARREAEDEKSAARRAALALAGEKEATARAQVRPAAHAHPKSTTRARAPTSRLHCPSHPLSPTLEAPPPLKPRLESLSSR
jgi:hypothetical protein